MGEGFCVKLSVLGKRMRETENEEAADDQER